MKSNLTTVNEYDEIDIYGSEDVYFMIMDVLCEHDDSHDSMYQGYLKALELIRREVWKNYGEKIYIQYEDEIKYELFFMLAEIIESSAYESISRPWEYEDKSAREILEMELEPFETLDWLFENYVDVCRVIPNDLLSGDSLLH